MYCVEFWYLGLSTDWGDPAKCNSSKTEPCCLPKKEHANPYSIVMICQAMRFFQVCCLFVCLLISLPIWSGLIILWIWLWLRFLFRSRKFYYGMIFWHFVNVTSTNQTSIRRKTILALVFANSSVGRNRLFEWPTRSPDLTSLEFFWCYLKSEISRISQNAYGLIACIKVKIEHSNV